MSNTNKVVDSVHTKPNGIILFREKIVSVDGNGNETFMYFRTSLSPGDDISGVPSEIKSLAQSLWTEDVIRQFKAQCQSLVFWISGNTPSPFSDKVQGA
jgi:hypothetical protein